MSLEARLIDLGDLAPLGGSGVEPDAGNGCGFGNCEGSDCGRGCGGRDCGFDCTGLVCGSICIGNDCGNQCG